MAGCLDHNLGRGARTVSRDGSNLWRLPLWPAEIANRKEKMTVVPLHAGECGREVCASQCLKHSDLGFIAFILDSFP